MHCNNSLGQSGAVRHAQTQMLSCAAQVKFVRVDIDTPDLANAVNDHSITGVPTFYLYKSGKRCESFVGARVEALKDLALKAASK